MHPCSGRVFLTSLLCIEGHKRKLRNKAVKPNLSCVVQERRSNTLADNHHSSIPVYSPYWHSLRVPCQEHCDATLIGTLGAGPKDTANHHITKCLQHCKPCQTRPDLLMYHHRHCQQVLTAGSTPVRSTVACRTAASMSSAGQSFKAPRFAC